MTLPIRTIMLGSTLSSDHQPDPAEMAEWGERIEALADATALYYRDDLADLPAASSVPDGAAAMVLNDATTSNRGIYKESSDTWTKVAELPGGFTESTSVILTPGGTANEITATANRSWQTGAYTETFLMPVAAANTGAVTVAIDGGTARALVTATGGALAANYLTAGMVVQFWFDGTKYRLGSAVSDAAAQAAAVAAATEAEGHADDAETAAADALTAQTAAETANTQAQIAAAAAGAPLYDSIANGLAGTSDEDIFLVASSFGFTVYQNDTGSEVLLGHLLTTAALPFANRAAAVAASIPDAVNVISYIDGNHLLHFIRDASGIALSTNGGTVDWSPVGKVSTRHFGIATDGSDVTSEFVAAGAWCASNGIALDIQSAIFGYTNIAIAGPGYHFDFTASEGPAVFQQLSTRTAGNMAFQLGGEDLLDTELSASVTANNRTVNLASVTGAQAGDLLWLQSNRLLEGDHRFDSDRTYSQLAKIRSVNTGSSFVITEELTKFDFLHETITSGTAQAGASGQITLAAGETVTENDIKGYVINITGGTGAGQSRYIHEYNAATKVVDIGTTYTDSAQDDWATTPDATSTYEIVAETTATIIRPATGKISGLRVIGYAEDDVIVNGGYVRRVDGFLVEDCHFSWLSNHGLYTAYSYKSTVDRCRFEHANYATGDGGGRGYGHMDLKSYMTTVTNCVANGCRTGFDNGGTTLFLRRTNCRAEGGGVTYTGSDFFFPMGASGVPNSGFSSHTGSIGGVDDGNTTVGIFDNKIRAQDYTVRNHQAFGPGNYEGGIFRVSYSPTARILNCAYDDLFTTVGDLDFNGDDIPGAPATQKRATHFVDIRHSTMPKSSTLEIRGNSAKSVSSAFIGLDGAGDAEGMFLIVRDNQCNLVSAGETILSIIKSNNADPSLRGLISYGNDIQVSGSDLGSLYMDNYDPYPIMDDMPDNGNVTYQVGPRTWLAVVDDDSAVELPIGTGFKRAKLTVLEKDGTVANHFCALITYGSTTAYALVASNGVATGTGALTGTSLADNSLNLSLRDDGRPMLENRTGQRGVFVYSLDATF